MPCNIFPSRSLASFAISLIFLLAASAALSPLSSLQASAALRPGKRPRTLAAQDRICLVSGGCWWLAGVNYPWLYYGTDFGQAAWPGVSWSHDGASEPASQNRLAQDFSFLSSQGVYAIRWFVFADGRASPEFDSQGNVSGFDSYFYADFDSALTLASQNHLKVIPVLLDYTWLSYPLIANGVQEGGHSDVITNTAKTQSFLNNALSPLLQRYAADTRIAAWEVINEPEWTMAGVPGGGLVGPTVPSTAMQAFAGQVVATVHRLATQGVTIGSAQGPWLSYWTGLGLDFYEYHYYDWMGQQAPFVSAASLGLDKPAVLGEFPTAGTAYTVTQYLDAAWDNGYAGAFAWSLNGVDSASQFTSPGPADAFRLWSMAHCSLVDLFGSCTLYLPAFIRR